MKEPYSLIWQACTAGSRLAERFHASDFDGHLPFLVIGKEVEAFTRGAGLRVSEEHLLAGLLYGLAEIEREDLPWHDPAAHPTYMRLLDILCTGFQFASQEQMILDVAAHVRERCGSLPSREMLVAGERLIPSSSKIRADLVLDSWYAALELEEGAGSPLDRVPELVRSIQMADVNPEAREPLAFYGLASLVLRGRHDEVEAFRSDVDHLLVSPWVKGRTQELLAAPSGWAQQDLTIPE